MHTHNTYHYCPKCGKPWNTKDATAKIGKHIACGSCGFILYSDPKVAVSVIVHVDGKIVMLERTLPTEQGSWAIPGGFVDAGESLETAAIREMREEVGLNIDITGLIGVYSNEGNPVILVVYEGKITGGKLECGAEALKIALFDYDSIPWESLAFDVNRKALHDYYKQNQEHMK
jgi:ADP-ribose pyrophosphatase YjhB (NUDIX family)